MTKKFAYRDPDVRLIMDEVELKRYYARATVDLQTGCWLFNSITFYLRGERFTVYEVAYETFIDAVPVGYELGHTCKNGSSQRPVCGFWEHVRPVTRKQNLHEVRGTIEACPQGHPRTTKNTYSSNGMCAVCCRIRTCHARGVTCCLSCGYRPCRCEQ